MPNRFDFGGVDLTAGENAADARPKSETPFCVAILGDFSGRGSRGITDTKTVGERRAIPIDRDNFDEVLASLKVELHLATEDGEPLVLRFSELDDFHPDHLFHLPAFRKLSELRRRLENPSTFDDVKEEIGLSSRTTNPTSVRRVDMGAAGPSPTRLASGSLLDAMIEQTEERAAVERTTRKPDEVREFARQLAAKYAVAAPDPRQPEFVAGVDHAVGDAMGKILHHPDFQALESIWRATFLLVRQLETGSRLKLYLFDISKAELATDVGSSNDVNRTGIFRLLVEQAILTPGADPWALVVGDYTFGPDANDVLLLSRMAKVAKRAGVPFLAGASSKFLGTESLEIAPDLREWERNEVPAWLELRHLPEAEFIGLGLPRLMARLPYGKQTSPVESFAFEEFPDFPRHDNYLWANPAFAVALLLAESFSESGWEMRPGTVAQLDKLPLHLFKGGSEVVAKPCAEVLLTEDAVERIVDGGFIPLISYKGRDSVRVARFQSIADPPKSLAGRWSA